MNDFASLNLFTVTSSPPCLDASQLDPSVNPSILVVMPMKDLSLSVVLAGDSLKSMNFGLSLSTELLTKSILSRAYTSDIFPKTVLGPITFLKIDVGCPCTSKIWLMGALSGPAFLASVAVMDCLGLTISWFPVRVGESEVLLKLGIGGVNLAVAMAVLIYCGVEPSLPVQLTSLGVCKMCAPLRAASIHFSLSIPLVVSVG